MDLNQLIENTKARQLQQQVSKQKIKIKAQGGKVKKGGPSVLSRIFDVISRPLYGISEGMARASEHAGPKNPRKGKSVGTDILKGIAGGLAGKDKTDMGETLMRASEANPGTLLSKPIRENKGNLRTIAGLGLNIGLDPLTYVGAGVVKSAGKGAAKAAGLKAVSEHMASEAVQTAANKTASMAVAKKSAELAESGGRGLKGSEKQALFEKAKKEAFVKEGKPVFKEVYEKSLTDAPGKVQLKFMGKKIAETEKGYAAIAKGGEKLGKTKFGTSFNEKFRTAHLLPEDTKRISRQIAQAGVKGAEQKAANTRAFFKDLTPEEKRAVSHAIEEGDVNLTKAEREFLQQGAPKAPKSRAPAGPGVPTQALKNVEVVQSRRAELGKMIEQGDDYTSVAAFKELQELQKSTPPSVWAESTRLEKEAYEAGRRIPKDAPEAKFTPEEVAPFTEADMVRPPAAPKTGTPAANIIGRMPEQIKADTAAVKSAQSAGLKFKKVEVGKKKFEWHVTAADGKPLGQFKTRHEANLAAIEHSKTAAPQTPPHTPKNYGPEFEKLQIEKENLMHRGSLHGETPEAAKRLDEIIRAQDKIRGTHTPLESAPLETPKPVGLSPEQQALADAKEQLAAFKRGEVKYERGTLTTKEGEVIKGATHPQVAVERAEAEIFATPEYKAKYKETENLDNEFYKYEGDRRSLEAEVKQHEHSLEAVRKTKAEVKTSAIAPTAPRIDKVAEGTIINRSFKARQLKPGDRIKFKGQWHLVDEIEKTGDKLRVHLEGTKLNLDPDMNLGGSVARYGEVKTVVKDVPIETTRNKNMYAKNIKPGDRILMKDGWKLVDEVNATGGYPDLNLLKSVDSSGKTVWHIRSGDEWVQSYATKAEAEEVMKTLAKKQTELKFADGKTFDIDEDHVGLGISRPLDRPVSRYVAHVDPPGRTGYKASYSVEPEMLGKNIEDGFKFTVKGPHYADGAWDITRDPAHIAVALDDAFKHTGYAPYKEAADAARKEAAEEATKRLSAAKKELAETAKKQKAAATRKEALEKELKEEKDRVLKEAHDTVEKAKTAKIEGASRTSLNRLMEKMQAKKAPIEIPVPKAAEVPVPKSAPKAPPTPKVPPAVPEAAADDLADFFNIGAPTKPGAVTPKPAAAVSTPAAAVAPAVEDTKPVLQNIANALKAQTERVPQAADEFVKPSMEKALSHPEHVYRSSLHGIPSSKGTDLGTYVDRARQEFREMGELEASMGLFKDMVDSKGNVLMKAEDWLKDNYVYHHYKGGDEKARGAFKAKRRKILGSDSPTFTKERKYASLKAAKAAGLKPVEEIDDILGIRIGKHYAAMARKKFVNETAAMYGLKVTDAATKTIAKENNMRTVKGVPGMKGVYFPEKIAKSLEATEELWNNKEATKKFFQLFDKAQGHWKFAATGLNPGHHTRNMVGDIWNNYLDGVVDPRRYGLSGRIMASKNRQAIRTQVGEITISGEELLQQNFRSGAAPGFFSSEFGVDLNALKPSTAKRKIIEMGEKREEYMRLAHFIDALKKEGKGIKKSWSPERQAKALDDAANRAAERVRKWNIDYGDLTEFESKVMKRAMPFYTWTRKNLPLQIEALAMRPGRVAAIPKAQSAVQRFLGTEEDYNEFGDGVLPKWLKEMAPIRLSEENEEGKSWVGVPALPFQDISKFVEGGKRGILQSVMSQLTPGMRIPIEQTTGQTLFSGAPIRSDTEYFSQQVPLARIGQQLIKSGEGIGGRGLTRDKLINYITGAGAHEIGPKQVASELRRQQDPLQNQIRDIRAKAKKKVLGR
jgi:hypothetical protein